MKNFFDFSIDHNYPNGFGMFSAGHFLWLSIGAVFCFLMCRMYRRAEAEARRSMRLITAWAAVVLELTRAALLMFSGEYDIGTLPLHLCGLTVYIGLFHALREGKLTAQFLYAFCMPGAVCALLFPDWEYYPMLHFMTSCGFELHILIVTYTLMQTAGGDIVPNIRKTPACLAFMLALAAPVYVFDILTDTNYMFLNWPSPGSPLEWFGFLGRPGYILGYLPMIGAAWAAMYYPFRKAGAQ